MNITDLNDTEKYIIFEALNNYQELIETTILTDGRLDIDDIGIYQRRLKVIDFLLEEFQ